MIVLRKASRFHYLNKKYRRSELGIFEKNFQLAISMENVFMAAYLQVVHMKVACIFH